MVKISEDNSVSVEARVLSKFEEIQVMTPGMLRKKGIDPYRGEPCRAPYIRPKSGERTVYEYTIGRDC